MGEDVKSTKLSPSLCIDAIFANLSFEQACRATAQANIHAIEFWAWWDKDLTALQAAVNQYDLSISCCCTKFISLVDSKQRAAYLQGLTESIAVAKSLNINTLISQTGDFIAGVPREQQKQSLTNLAEFSTHNLFGWRWIANQPLGWSILVGYTIIFACIYIQINQVYYDHYEKQSPHKNAKNKNP